MHYVAPGTYLERVGAIFVLTIEDTVIHDGRPMKLRVKREIPTEKLRAICPELFPIESPTIVDDVALLRKLVEHSSHEALVFGEEVGALIQRVLDHVAFLEASPFNFSDPKNVKGFDAFLGAIERTLEDGE